jgi:hypothetical protein
VIDFHDQATICRHKWSTRRSDPPKIVWANLLDFPDPLSTFFA